MSAATTMHFDSLPSGDDGDKSPSLITKGKEERKHDEPAIAANPTIQQSLKDDSEVIKNASKSSAGDDGRLQTSQVSSKMEEEVDFYQGLANKVLEDKEDQFEAGYEVRRTFYASFGDQQLLEEKNKFGTRKAQAMLHTAYTDLRVQKLENEVKKLRQDLGGLPDDFQLANSLEYPVYLQVLKRSTLHEFQLNDDSKAIPLHLRPALEVLLDDHGQLSTSAKENITSDNTSGSRHQSPERLRIRSRPLIMHIGRICGQNIPIQKGDDKSAPSSVVFLRPFKLLVAFELAIRASVQELEAQIEKKTAETTASNANPKAIRNPKSNASEYDDKNLLIDLKLLIEFFDVDLQSTFELRNKIRDGTATDIQYQDLWHLFERGEDVIYQFNKLTFYRVVNFTGGRDPLISKLNPEDKPIPVDGFTIDCYNLNLTGSSFGSRVSSFSIHRFRGFQRITSLPVYPAKFDTSFAVLKKDLNDRGARFLELTKLPYNHKLLVGTTLDEPAEEIDAQIIVDMTFAINKNPKWHRDLNFDESKLTTFDLRETQLPPFCHGQHSKYNEGCCGSDVVQKDLDFDKSKVDDYIRENTHALKLFPASELAEKDKVLLPHWVYGFVLRNRQWVTVNIDDLSEVTYGNNFDTLVLPQGHKETVKALVQNHAKPSTLNSAATSNLGAAMDLVRGKGKGLIILLHGEPGVGKTSTAECVADLTHRPLFPVTCGDIGETAADVQSNLDHNFQLAHKWGCVLLLDEADVFMAKRNKTDLRRNAVVSVFLRTLEYYSGILFLTTNRVGSIDPAFKSRIHMSLFYPHLGLDATLQLYQILINRTLAEQKQSKAEDFKVKPKEILRFAKVHFRRLEKEGHATWNGRQIRNAFQTAITLAEYNARQPGAELVTLGKAQFQIVANASKEFDVYMKETLGATEADLARREDIRYDRFGVGGSTETPPTRSDKGKHRYSHRPGRNTKDSESEDDDSSEASDEEEDDDDDEN